MQAKNSVRIQEKAADLKKINVVTLMEFRRIIQGNPRNKRVEAEAAVEEAAI